MVESIASATMSSAEESIFGNWMEGVAMFVANEVYGGYKSSAEGIDLEFDKEGVHYFVSVKSGPAWSNSTSMKKQKEQFRTARRVFNTRKVMLLINSVFMVLVSIGLLNCPLHAIPCHEVLLSVPLLSAFANVTS